jgi:hypothetical protein
MERPILFSAAMIQAILEGRKTQTRRVIKPQPLPDADIKKAMINGILHVRDENYVLGEDLGGVDCTYANYRPAPYQLGDVLWVRETWGSIATQNVRQGGYDQWFVYKAAPRCELPEEFKWRPSIFMPREAARIFLTVKDIRVERLQEITEEDAKAEGCITFAEKIGDGKSKDVLEFDLTARDAFVELWNNINAKRGYGWDKNPWVWVIEFEI